MEAIGGGGRCCCPASMQRAPSLEDGLPLHWACLGGQVHAAEQLIRADWDVDGRDKHGQTPAHWAARGLAGGKGAARVLLLLAEFGADMGLQDCRGFTPLHVASQRGQAAAVEALLQAAGAAASPADEAGATPLHWAAGNGHEPAVLELLRGGAAVDARDIRARLALHCAAAAGEERVCRLLLRAAPAAQLLARDAGGETPDRAAARGGSKPPPSSQPLSRQRR